MVEAFIEKSINTSWSSISKPFSTLEFLFVLLAYFIELPLLVILPSSWCSLIVLFPQRSFSSFFLKNMGRRKMVTATAIATDLTFDFHLNKSSNQVRNPFPLANRVGDPDWTRLGWLWAEWEHLYWDDAFPASASLDFSIEATMTFSLLDVDESEGKRQ